MAAGHDQRGTRSNVVVSRRGSSAAQDTSTRSAQNIGDPAASPAGKAPIANNTAVTSDRRGLCKTYNAPEDAAEITPAPGEWGATSPRVSAASAVVAA
ncbi:hypothetical protein GCM10017612_43460 [Novosphingobium resinovorum]|nr:hypothetical protein GCM10017612_43460 [Novosphingobium resinovorum]